MRSYEIDRPQKSDIPRLLQVWEASVRATHDFVNEEKIGELKQLIVEKELFLHSDLICVRNDSGDVEGFAGTSGETLDMLFISPGVFRSGAGSALILHAINVSGVTKVDVNEQNDHAREFYERFGFTVVGRSETDEYGNPFPILHMSRQKT